MRKKSNFLPWILVLIVIFVGINFFFPFLPVIREGGRAVTFPMQKTLHGVAAEFHGRMEIFRNAKDLQDKVANLRSKEKELQVTLAKLEEVKKENRALMDALDVELEREKELVFGEITGRELSGDRLLIFHSEEVTQGSPVVTPEGVLIGVISSSGERFSEVELLTSKNSSFEVKVQNDEEPIGVLRGKGEKTLLLDLIPKEVELKRGDRVVSLAGEKMGMEDIFIGRVLEVKVSDVEAFDTALVWQGVDHRRLSHVFIIES